jgi:hypothetical protein
MQATPHTKLGRARSEDFHAVRLNFSSNVKRRSKHLAGAAADNLREATYFAAERGTPINCAISINWALFSGTGISDDTRLARAQERMRHRLERQGHELVSH